jgi:hypothetical protein
MVNGGLAHLYLHQWVSFSWALFFYFVFYFFSHILLFFTMTITLHFSWLELSSTFSIWFQCRLGWVAPGKYYYFSQQEFPSAIVTKRNMHLHVSNFLNLDGLHHGFGVLHVEWSCTYPKSLRKLLIQKFH